MSAPLPPRLERRLELSGADFLVTDPTLAALSLRGRDVASLLTAEGAPTIAPVILLHARDEGRVANYAEALRKVSLAITLRFNKKLPSGTPAAIDALCQVIEALFTSANLTSSLNSTATRRIAVLHAARRAGSGHRIRGFIFEERYQLDCKAVAYENTVQGAVPDGAWVDGDQTQVVDGDGTSIVL